MMTFLNPAALLFLLLIPAALAFFAWRERQRQAARDRLGDTALLQLLFPTYGGARRRWRAGLWLAAVGAVIIALARPAWGTDLEVLETQGVSVMIILDVSNSMLARDVLPNRLERARLAVRDLLAELEGNELGLIVFAGEAYVQFPLTSDPSSALTFLNAVSTASVATQGTATEAAIRLAIDSFDEQSSTARAIVLMTDGEDHIGDPLNAADFARESGVVIHGLGYGSLEGSLIPILDELGNETGYRTDRNGAIVESRLNESLLRAISERTGGVYQRADTGEEVQRLIAQIRTMEAGFLESEGRVRLIERFGIFVAVAVLALSIEILLPENESKNQ